MSNTELLHEDPDRIDVAQPPKWNRTIFWIVFTLVAVVLITLGCCWTLRTFGLEAMLILFVVISGAIWGWIVRWLYASGKLTVSHILVVWMVWTGTILGGASYYLAYKDLAGNLETLSRYIMVEVVAGVGGYFVKSGVENSIRLRNSRLSTRNDDDVVRDL